MSESDHHQHESSEDRVAPEDSTSSVRAEATVVEAGPALGAGIFADPVVRRLAWVGGLMVVAFLTTVASALYVGVLDPPAPRTAVERQLSLGEIQIDSGSTDPQVWFSYISALILGEQYSKAERMIERAQDASIEDPTKQYLLLAQVRLDLAREDYEKALEDSDAAMAALEAQLEYEREQYAATKQPTVMVAEGLGENYETLQLSRAEAYEQLGQIDESIATLDIYLNKNERAADILVWRGDLKSDSGDSEGAIADYEAASIYMPGDEELLEKLRELGATDE